MFFRNMLRALTFSLKTFIQIFTSQGSPCLKVGLCFTDVMVGWQPEDLEHSALKSNRVGLCSCAFRLAVVTLDLASVLETCRKLQSKCFTDELTLLFQIVKTSLAYYFAKLLRQEKGSDRNVYLLSGPSPHCWISIEARAQASV